MAWHAPQVACWVLGEYGHLAPVPVPQVMAQLCTSVAAIAASDEAKVTDRHSGRVPLHAYARQHAGGAACPPAGLFDRLSTWSRQRACMASCRPSYGPSHLPH